MIAVNETAPDAAETGAASQREEDFDNDLEAPLNPSNSVFEEIATRVEQKTSVAVRASALSPSAAAAAPLSPSAPAAAPHSPSAPAVAPVSPSAAAIAPLSSMDGDDEEMSERVRAQRERAAVKKAKVAEKQRKDNSRGETRAVQIESMIAQLQVGEPSENKTAGVVKNVKAKTGKQKEKEDKKDKKEKAAGKKKKKKGEKDGMSRYNKMLKNMAKKSTFSIDDF